jgi:hypothetical protein
MSVVGIDGEVRCGRSSESVSVRVVEGYRRQREWKGPESAMRVGDGGWWVARDFLSRRGASRLVVLARRSLPGGRRPSLSQRSLLRC